MQRFSPPLRGKMEKLFKQFTGLILRLVFWKKKKSQAAHQGLFFIFRERRSNDLTKNASVFPCVNYNKLLYSRS